MSRTCPFCNRNVLEKDKWCPWCGKKLSDAPRQKPTVIEDKTESEPTTQKPISMTPQTTPSRPTMAVLPIPEETAIEQYLIRIKIEQMDAKLKESKEKINNYLEKIETQGGELSDEDIQELKELVNKIKIKREELISKKMELPFEENLLQVRQELEEKLRKVQNTFMTKQISEVAYNKLKSEYEKELEDIKKKMTVQREFETILKSKLEVRKKNYQDELEVLKAKLAIKEISEGEYQERMATTQKDLENTNLILSKLLL